MSKHTLTFTMMVSGTDIQGNLVVTGLPQEISEANSSESPLRLTFPSGQHLDMADHRLVSRSHNGNRETWEALRAHVGPFEGVTIEGVEVERLTSPITKAKKGKKKMVFVARAITF